MQNARMQRPPPPPRRAPPTAAPGPSTAMSSGTFLSTHVILRPSGVAVLSQQLVQVKDSVNDIKIAVATAEDSLRAISTNRAVRPPSPRDGAATGGADVQSLAFASMTLSKLAEEERRQDAFYATLRESAAVHAEMQCAARDPVLQRYKQHVECQMAASMADGRLPPQLRRGSVPPEQHQLLLNPYSTVRQSSASSALTVSANASSTPQSTGTSAATAGSVYGGRPQQSQPHGMPSSTATYYGASPYPTPAAAGQGTAYGLSGASSTSQNASRPPQSQMHTGYGQPPPLHSSSATPAVYYGQPPQPGWNPQQNNGHHHYQAL